MLNFAAEKFTRSLKLQRRRRRHAVVAEAFFKPKLADIEGGPRALALALESVRLCVAKRKAHEPNMRTYFDKK